MKETATGRLPSPYRKKKASLRQPIRKNDLMLPGICHTLHQGSTPAIDFVGVPGLGPVDLLLESHAVFDSLSGRSLV